MRLNLGCADTLIKGWLNVDRYLAAPPESIQTQLADLERDWPWLDSTSEEIRAHDIFEHLRDKRHTMNEAWRVLQPGGKLDLIVPTTDGRGAFQDPTHKSWWTPNDLFYFCEGFEERKRFGASYGIRALFKIVSSRHEKYPNEVWKLSAILEAVK